MTQPIDIAYVDIVARDKSLREFRGKVDDTFKKVDKDITSHLESINDEFDDTFRKIDKHFTKVADNADVTFTKVEKKIHETLRDVDVDIDRRSGRIRRTFSALGAHVGDIFETIKRGITRGLKGALDLLGDGVQKIGSAIGSIFGTIGSAAASNPLITLVLLLLPAILALAAALSQLIGLVGVLPASFSVLVAAIAPVVVAFQNFGDAVSAVAEGDVEKIRLAMFKLAPSAADAAREIGLLLPELKTFQKLIQEAFFVKFRGGITQLVHGLLPTLTDGFRTVNFAMGTLVKQFINFATSSATVKTVGDVFAATGRIISQLSGPIIKLLGAITATVDKALPFVERLAAAFGRALTNFAGFINKSIESGAFSKFIEDAFTTVKELLALLKAVGSLIGVIFTGLESEGHSFLQTLTDVINRMADFLKSPEGQRNIKAFIEAVKATAAILSFMVDAGIKASRIAGDVVEAFKEIGSAFISAGKDIGDFFGRVPRKIDEFGAFLKSVPQLIGNAIKQVIDNVLHAIGIQIGLILFAIQVLPGKIIEFIGTIPQRIADAFIALGPLVLGVFTGMLTSVKDLVVNGFNEVVEFIFSIPDRIKALGPAFLRAGINLIQSFMNGFRAVGSFIGDIAGDIVHAVKSFLNRAIDKINSGIAEVDAVLPGNLARIPHLAAGAIVSARPGGVLANISEGGEDEVVSPLSTLEDIIRRAFGGDGSSGMTVNFGAGAISVNFAGAVPTEQEARTVGRAVADGIANQLAARNIRTQVRAA